MIQSLPMSAIDKRAVGLGWEEVEEEEEMYMNLDVDHPTATPILPARWRYFSICSVLD